MEVATSTSVIDAYLTAVMIRDDTQKRVEIWGEGLENGPVMVLLKQSNRAYEKTLNDSWIFILDLFEK
jgi:hypothetical protein